MPRNRLIIFFLFIFLSTSFAFSSSKSEQNAMMHFIDQGVKIAETTADDYWYGMWRPTPKPPDGGYLTKFYYDATGDGVEELFLKTSSEDYGNGERWSIYKLNEDGSFKEILGNKSLSNYFGVVKRDGEVILSNIYKRFRIKENGEEDRMSFLYTKREYIFDKEGNAKERKFEISEQEANTWYAKRNRMRKAIANKKPLPIEEGEQIYYPPEGEKIALMDYLENPENAKWYKMRSWFYGLMPQRCVIEDPTSGLTNWIDPEREKDIERCKGFTPQKARKLLEAWEDRSKKEKAVEKALVGGGSAIENTSQEGASVIAQKKQEPSRLWLWIGGGFLLILGSVVYWRFVRKE